MLDNKNSLEIYSNYMSDPDVYVADDNDLDLATDFNHIKDFGKKSRQVVDFLSVTCLEIPMTIFTVISWNKV